jgi:hypothetical protein
MCVCPKQENLGEIGIFSSNTNVDIKFSAHDAFLE